VPTSDPHDKYKGRSRHRRSGLGRLRSASESTPGRLSGWERSSEDDAVLEQHGERQRATHTGERLLAKFNRLARDTHSASGEAGVVSGFAGASVLVRAADGEHACEVRSALTKQIRGVRNPLCVGDRVRFLRAEGGGGSIVAVEPRDNQLARTDSHNKALLHVLAANIDRLVVVASGAQPDLKPGFIDRYLLIAEANNIVPVIVFNKSDLSDISDIVEVYRALRYDCYVTTATNPNQEIDRLREALRSLTTLVAGQSGVGKSTLINVLYPTTGARTGSVSSETGLGRHTTTASRSYPLPDGGSLIDTPGLRECGITGLTPVDVALLYRDIAAYHPQCHFNDCSHRHEPDCAVIAAVESGAISVFRYQSYCSILDEDLGA
jgi:ribosome biogenesis GTPase / thiamine phosphate phosphatase